MVTRKGLRNLFSRPVDGSSDELRLTTKPAVSQQVEPERPVTHVSVVLNWFSEVTRLVASGGK